jgi:hypothetical protein
MATYDALVLQARVQATQILQHLANSEGFKSLLQTAFGNSFSDRRSQRLLHQWQAGNFSRLPQVEILTQGELGQANGAYAAASNTIYLSSSFLDQHSNDLAAVTDVLLEEIGHGVDQVLNRGRDSAGDEGEIFRLLVRGVTLSPEQLQSLRSQNDHAVVTIGGRLLAMTTSLERLAMTNSTAMQAMTNSTVEMATTPSIVDMAMTTSMVDMAMTTSMAMQAMTPSLVDMAMTIS